MIINVTALREDIRARRENSSFERADSVDITGLRSDSHSQNKECLSSQDTMTEDTLNALESFFQQAPILKAGPVSRSEVDGAFGNFRIPLPEDYLTFVEKYGGAIVGPYRVYGLRKAAPMGNKKTSAVAVTEDFVRQQWLSVEKWLVISMDHSGNPIGLASDGTMWLSDHDTRQVTKIADSFEDFIRSWCLKVQNSNESPRR